MDDAREMGTDGEPCCICRCLSFTRPFLSGSCVTSDHPPLLSVLIHLVRNGMPLHDGVVINRENGATTEIKVQEPSIWAKGCMVGDCARVIGLYMTAPP